MNEEWSQLNHKLQQELKNKNIFRDGIETAILLRYALMKQIDAYKMKLQREDFNAIGCLITGVEKQCVD